MTDLLPDEEEHVAFFKSRDIPTVRLQWLSRMKRFERVTSWTQWALDPKYREEHLIEDHLLAAERCILGLTNVGEICKSLSRRVSSDALVFWVVTASQHHTLADSCASTVPSPPHQVVRRTTPGVQTRGSTKRSTSDKGGIDYGAPPNAHPEWP